MSLRATFFRFVAVVTMATITAPGATAEGETKHVFELFTSQGCYSCPPAEELLVRIIKQYDDILALEYHVDYWDSLVYGAAGQWKDPFSSPKYSQRQRDYNQLRLEGRTGVYTPQIVVDGAYAFVGSKSMKAQSQMSKDSRLTLTTSAEVSADGRVRIEIAGDDRTQADVWLVSYDKEHVTKVTAGENMGKKLKNANVVRKFESIGRWRGEPLVIESKIEPLTDNQNCAVLVQAFSHAGRRVAGPILGAADCTAA